MIQLSVTDNGNGTGAFAQVTGIANLDLHSRIYVASLPGTNLQSAGDVPGGLGSIQLALPVGSYLAFGYLWYDDNNGNVETGGVTNSVFFKVTDDPETQNLDDPLVDLCERVKQSLHTVGLLAASRNYLPGFGQEQLEEGEYHLFVVPRRETAEANTRSRDQLDRQVMIALVAKLRTGASDTFDRSQLDGLMATMRQIKSHLRVHRRLGDFGWVRTEHEPIFDPEAMETHRQFASVVTATYRTIESP